MQAIFTTDAVLAHYAAMSGVLRELASADRLERGAYSLDHLDAMSAMLAAASMANRIVGEPIKTFTDFTRFCESCAHIAGAMQLDIPNDKCIHQLTAFIVTEIVGDGTGEVPRGQTIN